MRRGKPLRERRSRIAADETGLTYLGVIIIAATLSTSLAAAGIVWHFAQQREREDELMYVGNQFRVAIGRYYLNQLGPQKEYPKRLEDLLRDPRHPGQVGYIRKLYPDPITGSTDWGLLKLPDGSILGVYSKSERKPIKTGRFGALNRHLERKSKYSDWKFAYLPGQPLSATSAGQMGDTSRFGNNVPSIESLAGPPADPGRFGTPLPSAGEPPPAPLERL